MNEDNYFTPNLESPLVLGAKVSQFGEQQGSGTDPGDQGGFAYGGSSTNDTEPYVAVDPEWVKQGIVKPGDSFPIWNPNNPDKVVWGVVRDKGPSRYTGRGLDLAPNIMQQLGLKTDDVAHFDFSQARPSTPVQSDQSDEQQPIQDLTTPEGARSAVEQNMAMTQPLASNQAPSAGVVSTDSAAPTGQVYKQYPDGSIDVGGGLRGFPNGIIQAQAGNSITEYIPDPTKPSGYMIHTYQTKPADQPAPPIPDGASADDALKQLSPEDQISVKDLVAGKAPAFTRYGKESPNYSRLKSYVHLVDPNFDTAGYATRTQTLMQYRSQAANSPGAIISSTNQAIKHLGTLSDINKELAGSNFPDVQGIENYLSNKFGQQSVNDFKILRTTLATEIARALQKGVPTLDQIKEWQNNIDENLGNAQRRSALFRDIPAVLDGQLETLDEGYTKGTNQQMPLNHLLYPNTQSVLRDKIGLKQFAGRQLTDQTTPVTTPTPTYIKDKIYKDAQGHQARYTGDPNNPWQVVP